MKFSTSARTIVTGSLLALALAGCGGGRAEGTNAQGLVAGASQDGRGGGRGFRGHRDPAEMARRMDRDGDGSLEVAELPERMQERLRAADTNSDGVLSAEEMTAHREAQRAAHFARMDANSDGAVTQDEAGPGRWEHLTAADADRDGRITRQELDAAHASGALRPRFGFGHGAGRGMGMGMGGGMGHRGGHDPARMIQRFDQNGDGSLQVAELPPRMQQRLGTADTNGDGVIAADELTASMERHRAERMAQEPAAQ